MTVIYNPFTRKYDFTLSPSHTHDQYIVDWKESVSSKTVAYGDAVASGTNRYIAPTTSGAWTADNIYQWNESIWDETVPNEGAAVFVEDEEKVYVYNNAAWVLLGTIIDHGNLEGLADDDHTQYFLADGTRSLSGNLLPNASGTIDIGSSALPFKDLYLTSASLYIDGIQTIQATEPATGNLFLGTDAGLNHITGGNYNVVLGQDAMYYNEDGDENVVIGYQAGYGVSGNSYTQATLVGMYAGYGLTTAPKATLIGSYAGYLLSTGSSNTAIGAFALPVNTDGYGNTAVGESALTSATDCEGNAALGMKVGRNLLTGSFNVYLGARCAYEQENGDNNVVIGYEAGFSVNGNSYSDNVLIGSQAGYSLTTGSGNIFLGYKAGYNETTGSNKLYIENSDSSSPLIYGEFDNDLVRINGDLKVTGSITSNIANVDVDTGTETVDTFADTKGDGVVWHVVVKKTTNLRTATVMACWDSANNVEYTETATNDLGDTTGLTLAVDISANNVRLRATATSDNWTVKAIRMLM